VATPIPDVNFLRFSSHSSHSVYY